MGEHVETIGPVVDQVTVQNVDTRVNDIEITIQKPGLSWLVMGVIRFQQAVADPERRCDIMFAVNGAVVEITRENAIFNWTGTNFRAIQATAVLEGLVPGDTIQLFGLQSVDVTTNYAANLCRLQVIAFGPEFRPQGFLLDTG